MILEVMNVRIMVDESVIEMDILSSIRTPEGIYDLYVLDLMGASSSVVVAGEYEGGNVLIKNGNIKDLAIRGYLDIIVLDKVSVDYFEVRAGQVILIDSEINRALISVDDVLEFSFSTVNDANVKIKELSYLNVRNSELRRVNVNASEIKNVIMLGSRNNHTYIYGGRWTIDTIDTLILVGYQIWDGAFRFDLHNYKNFIGENLIRMSLKDVYVPRWLEMVVSYRNWEREFSKIIEKGD